MRRIGFTGTREGLTHEQHTSLRFWMEKQPDTELHHGDCVGADEAAHEIAHSLRGWRIVIHPGLGNPALRANCTDYNVLCPAKPNLDRNTDIVNATHFLLACPKGPEELRSGTWSTVRKARRAKKEVVLFMPDGQVLCEANVL